MASTQSAAFASFLEQLHATGYAKGHGYNPKWFDQMSDAEKQQAETLLIDGLNKGDIIAADALGELATLTAVQALLHRLNQTQVPSWDNAELASALWKATQDLKYQDLLIDNLSIKNDLRRNAVTVGLLATARTSKLLDTCVSLAESDPYSTARFTAAEGALHIVGLLPDRSVLNHPYRPLLIRIASEDALVRTQAVSEFRALIDAARVNIPLP
jgi:hypothetical protein